jgi:modulator of FtsH protease
VQLSIFYFKSEVIMDYNSTSVAQPQGRSIEINKVLKNTYLLLSMTLIFSGAMAGLAMAMNVSLFNPFINLIVMFGLLFAVHKTAESSMGLVLTFAFTGWMGFTLGPVLSMYVAAGAGSIVMQALAGTGLIFFALSGYVLTTKKDFSFMRGFLFAGLMVVIFGMLGGFIAGMMGYDVSAFSLAISGAIVLLMSGFILYDTSSIMQGHETNYIRATVSMYLNLYNLFISLLHLLTALGGDD